MIPNEEPIGDLIGSAVYNRVRCLIEAHEKTIADPCAPRESAVIMSLRDYEFLYRWVTQSVNWKKVSTGYWDIFHDAMKHRIRVGRIWKYEIYGLAWHSEVPEMVEFGPK